MHIHHSPRLAAGVLAAFALLSAACKSEGATSPLASSAPVLFANSRGDDGRGSVSAAAGFTVLGQAAASCTNGSVMGSVGTFQTTPPGAITLVTCPVSGGLHVGDAAAKAAFNAFVARYDALAPRTGDCDLAHTLLSTIPASTTLYPGVYCTGAALTASDVTLTLDARGDANATWVFKIGSAGPAGTGALTGTNFAVLLANGAQACNVTWWVSQAATISTTTTPGTAFQGNILAGAAITLNRGTVNGNAYAGAKTAANGVKVGDVTVTGTSVVGCAAGLSGGGGGGGGGDDGDDDDDDHDDRGGKGKHDKDKDHDKDKRHNDNRRGHGGGRDS